MELNPNKDIFTGVIITLVVLLVLSLIVYDSLSGPDSSMCWSRARELHIPCMPGTAQWREDECECISAQDPSAKLQFDLAERHGRRLGG